MGKGKTNQDDHEERRPMMGDDKTTTGITRRGSVTIVDQVLCRAVTKLLGGEALDADEERALDAAGQDGINEVARMITGDGAAEVEWRESL
jgi:hypothetical protein